MKELKVTPIKNGTVIDHITPGHALKVLHVLKIPESTVSVVSILMNVNGKKGKKDIVKVENRELDPKEVNKIALLAPKATINIIRDYEVVKKYSVQLPTEVIGLIKCSNPTCISNAREPVESRFHVISRDPPRIRCYYCEREPDDITVGII
ncbi:aspartate carbamoyltransferase regulatory subunit [Thermoplasmatales archaeon SM1-50]|nr:MAG: aspartate carbamoyltransferase regulatory subunit [Thermoplasmatales archaeon SM1-50]